MEIKCAYDELVDISLVVENKRNPNTHSNEQIKYLAKIMAYRGWRSPLVVSNRSGLLVCGHGRLAAAKLNGWIQAPVDKQDFENEADEIQHMIADNEIARLAEADHAMIRELALEMPAEFDFELLGIPDFQLQPIIEPGCDEDSVPENVEPITKLGDLYVLGNHRLLCGDSTNIQHVERLMNGEKADMVFTDPPYGMGLDTDYSKMAGTGKKHKRGLVDDFKPELIQSVLGVFSYCKEIFLFGADYYSDALVDRDSGSWVVWDKRSKGEEYVGLLDDSFGSDFEMCWSKAKHQRKIARVLKSNGWQTMKSDEQSVHPTQKPVALAEWFFERWAKGLTNIADLFGGSGSTLIACEKTNRKCFMAELDPHYCDVIVARWEKFTGKTAVLETQTQRPSDAKQLEAPL